MFDTESKEILGIVASVPKYVFIFHLVISSATHYNWIDGKSRFPNIDAPVISLVISCDAHPSLQLLTPSILVPT